MHTDHKAAPVNQTRRPGFTLATFLQSIAVAITLGAPAVHAKEPPHRYPLIPIDAGQDGEDVAMGITDFYAGFEAFSITFTPGSAGNDLFDGEPLAESVTISFEPALAAEMGDDGGETADIEPGLITVTLEAPGLGWAIQRSYGVPGSPIVILSAHHEGDPQKDPHDELTFVTVDAGEVQIAHTALAHNKLDRPDAPQDWPFPTYPAVIETATNVPTSRRSVWDQTRQTLTPPEGSPPVASLIIDDAPTSLTSILPETASLEFSEIWWRDDARRAHIPAIQGLFWTLTNTALILETMPQEGATVPAAEAIRAIVDGKAKPAQREDLKGRWQAEILSPDADGVVSALSAGPVEIREGRSAHPEIHSDPDAGFRLAARLYALTHGVTGTVLLGGLTGDGSAPGYSGWTGPFDTNPPASDIAGVIYTLSESRAVAIVNADDPMTWTLIRLQRTQ